MTVKSTSVDARAEWFAMIIGYLKLKSLTLWFHVHPESSYQQFEEAWPFMLDQMMWNATHVAIEHLHKVCDINLSFIWWFPFS